MRKLLTVSTDIFLCIALKVKIYDIKHQLIKRFSIACNTFPRTADILGFEQIDNR